MKKLMLLAVIINSQTLIAQNVGIGTLTPAQKLHVAGTIRTTALEGDQTNDLNISNNQSINSSAILFTWFTGFNERMRITNAGNVGIGTATPDQLLEVVGPENTSIDLKTGALTLRSSVNSIAGAEFGTVSAHTLNLFTNNLNRLTILSGGNVGIGTLTPAQKLHVAGTIRTTALEGDQTNDLNISNSQSINSSAILFTWFTGFNERMRITNAGNVGIGTATPGQLLEVVGPENTSIDLKTGALTLRSSVNSIAGAQFGTVSAHPLNLFTNNLNRLTILSGGNVGIGTLTPAQKLHVAGSIRTTALEGDQTNDLNISNSQSINSTAILFAWYTGANERMRISNAGNVGIGTANPGQLLEVVGPENTSIDLKTGALTLRSSVNSAVGAQLGTVSAHTLNLFTNNANRLTILSGGNVGIGTATPGQLLEVVGPENTSIDLKTGALTLRSSVNSVAGAQFGTVSAHTLNLFTNNTNRLTILSGG
ncbi:MAG: hypothetical protein ABIR78_07190, partial [Ferruginibacter sp.]